MFRRLVATIEGSLEWFRADKIELISKSVDSDIVSLNGIPWKLDSGELVKKSSSSALNNENIKHVEHNEWFVL